MLFARYLLDSSLVIRLLERSLIELDLRLQKYLEDYIEFWDKLNTRSLPILRELCVPNFSFCDPYHSVVGVDEACDILAHRQKVFTGGRYHVYDFMWGRREGAAYMHWNFTYRPKKKFLGKVQDDVVIGGMSKLVFLPDGQLLSHEDFFAAHDVAEMAAYKKLAQ